MTDSLCRIFPILSRHCDVKTSRVLSSDRPSGLIFIEQGDDRIAESLLFQAAVSSCHEVKQVTLIRSREFTSLPPMVHGMPDTEPDAMSRLKIQYFSDMVGLLNYLSKLHITGYPDVLLLCGLDQYLAAAQLDHLEHGIAKLCAAVLDAAAFMHEKTDGSSIVMVSTQDKTKSYADIYGRFFSSIFLIRSSENGRNFEVVESNPSENDETLKLTAYYKDSQIFFKELHLKQSLNKKVAS